MKERINGKTYNTDTAERIGFCDNVDGVKILSRRDLGYSSTGLYRRRNGEYFFTYDGRHIAPASALEARNFCYSKDEEKEWTTADLNKEFGGLEELTAEAVKSEELARQKEEDLYQMKKVLHEKYQQLSEYAQANAMTCAKALELAISNLTKK